MNKTINISKREELEIKLECATNYFNNAIEDKDIDEAISLMNKYEKELASIDIEEEKGA